MGKIQKGIGYQLEKFIRLLIMLHLELVVFGYGTIDGPHLYDSSEEIRNISYYFRPVITLNSNVQLDTTKAADGTQPSTAYEIK
jgi:hypothetical protein